MPSPQLTDSHTIFISCRVVNHFMYVCVGVCSISFHTTKCEMTFFFPSLMHCCLFKVTYTEVWMRLTKPPTYPSSFTMGIWSICSRWKVSVASSQETLKWTVMGVCSGRLVTGWFHHHSASLGIDLRIQETLLNHPAVISKFGAEKETRRRNMYTTTEAFKVRFFKGYSCIVR